MSTRLACASVVLVLFVALGPRGLGAQAPADSAWNAGGFDRAERLYEQRLAADSSDARALHRLALMAAWDGRTARSLELFDRLLALYPENRAARHDRAMVLGWAGRLRASREAYAAMVAADSSDLEALEGLARVRAWQDDLRASERLWRGLLRRDPDRTDAVVGLARVLRWQGRPAAARGVLRRDADAPEDPSLARERRWVDAALAPFVETSAGYEGDSDANRIWTARLHTGVHLVPRLAVTGESYVRRASEDRPGAADPEREAAGGLLQLEAQLAPGWRVAAGGGVAVADSGRDEETAVWRASVESPRQLPVQVRAAYRREPLDVTRQLVAEGVEIELVDVALTVTPGSGWRIDLSAAPARFHGRIDNERLAGRLAVEKRLGAHWAVGAGARAFAFERNLDLGYFDPDFYGLAEATVRWTARPGPWRLRLEVAPGAQQVGEEGDVEGAFRGGVGVGLRIAPGREVRLSGNVSTTGLQSFSTEDADYRYGRVGLSLRWSF